MKRLKLDYIVPFLFLFSLIIIVFSSLTFHVDNVRIDNEQTEELNEGWVMSTDNSNKTDIVLPKKVSSDVNETITLTHRLTQEYVGLTLAFQSADQLVKVFYNGVEAYSFGYNNERAFGKTPGSSWHIIRIPTDLTNGEIKIELSSPYKNHAGNLPNIYIGTKSACVFHLFKSKIIGFAISIFILMYGIFLTIFYFFTKKHENGSKSLLYLGEFSILISMACIIETRLLQLFLGNQSVFSVSIFLLHMLAPIPIILYLGEVYFTEMRNKCHKIAIAFLANFILIVGLQLFNISDFMESNWLNHALLIISIIYVIATFIKTIVLNKLDPNSLYFFGSLLVLVISILLDVVGFYFFNFGDVTVFQRLGFTYFIISLSIRDIRKVISLIQKGLEAETLRHIAYEDILTKCKNRFYFEETFTETEKKLNHSSIVGIAIFDINNLKKINDYKGHSEGDYMLIHSANLINEYFSDFAQVCRIGGDEFAFIVSEIPPAQLEEKFIHFNQAMKNKRKNNPIDFEIAYGFAYYNPAIDRELQATFVRADCNMYACKKDMKSRQQYGTL
jgi:diguanylate cyclase